MKNISIGDMNMEQLREYKKTLGIEYELFDSKGNPQCVNCGKPYKQAFDTISKKVSKYLWRPDCDCLKNPNLRLAIA